MNIEVIRYRLPVYWAYALINGDYTGLSDNDKVGMSEMTLRVDKCDRCSGCAFENYIYDCVKSGCLGCEREDGESVRYTIVNT